VYIVTEALMFHRGSHWLHFEGRPRKVHCMKENSYYICGKDCKGDGNSGQRGITASWSMAEHAKNKSDRGL
jgi:hypothetical protein